MLNRVYIDNFRCFVNFEHRPLRRELILGRNGSGKSSYLDALLALRRFVAQGETAETAFPMRERTRWVKQPNQTFEIDVALEGSTYTYRLVLDSWGDPIRPRVVSESVQVNGQDAFRFADGNVQLYDGLGKKKNDYPFDRNRSALAMVPSQGDNGKVTQLKDWLYWLGAFQINPFAMQARAETEQAYPDRELSNFASWYRHLLQNSPRENAAFLESLRESMDDFDILKLEKDGGQVRSLAAEFRQEGGVNARFSFEELSDGQRCLICLYAILHFFLAQGFLVILDEPENFISLREIQPWLMAAADAIEEDKGQLLLISHHPEVINQWAPHAIEFFRDGVGPVRTRTLQFDSAQDLSPAELIARGWKDD